MPGPNNSVVFGLSVGNISSHQNLGLVKVLKLLVTEINTTWAVQRLTNPMATRSLSTSRWFDGKQQNTQQGNRCLPKDAQLWIHALGKLVMQSTVTVYIMRSINCS